VEKPRGNKENKGVWNKKGGGTASHACNPWGGENYAAGEREDGGTLGGSQSDPHSRGQRGHPSTNYHGGKS